MNNRTKDNFWIIFKSPLPHSISPAKYSLSLTIGFYLGLFPVVGLTTLLGTICALVFRLNIYLVQAMNLLLTPIQLLLLLPFCKLGQLMFFQNKKAIIITVQHFIESNNWEILWYLLETALAGITIWLLLSATTCIFVYRFFLKLSRKLLRSNQTQHSTSQSLPMKYI